MTNATLSSNTVFKCLVVAVRSAEIVISTWTLVEQHWISLKSFSQEFPISRCGIKEMHIDIAIHPIPLSLNGNFIYRVDIIEMKFETLAMHTHMHTHTHLMQGAHINLIVFDRDLNEPQNDLLNEVQVNLTVKDIQLGVETLPKTYTGPMGYSNITLSFYVTCAENWYGPYCNINPISVQEPWTVSHNNGIRAHTPRAVHDFAIVVYQ